MMEKEPKMKGTSQAEVAAPGQLRILLAAETGFQKERRAYQPGLCPALAAGGITRPLDRDDLEVLKVAREQLPFVSQNRLLEIIPGAQPPEGAPAPGDRPLRGAGPGGTQRHRRGLRGRQSQPSRQPARRFPGRPQGDHQQQPPGSYRRDGGPL